MKRIPVGAESVILGAVAITLLAAAALLAHGASWHLRTIHIVLLTQGLLFASCALASAVMRSRFGTTLRRSVVWPIADEVRNTWQWLRAAAGAKDAVYWVSAVTVVGVAIRAYFLNQPMRYDEAFTFLQFASGSFDQMMRYSLPNNHVLHTLLVRASTIVFGSHPVAIRLPAFLAGSLVIPTSFLLARLLFKGRGGYLTAALCAVWPFLVLYDTMARGYSMIVLLSLWLAILGLRFSMNPSLVTCFLMSLTTALGMLTIPSFLLPAAGVTLWAGLTMVARKTGPGCVCARLLLPFGVMTVVLTGLFYTPVIFASNGIGMIVRNRFVTGIPMGSFLARLPSHCSSTAADFVRDVPSVVFSALLLFILVGLIAAARRRDWAIVALLPALMAGAFAVLLARHSIPFARTWVFLLPFLFLLADAGGLAIGSLMPAGLGRPFDRALFIGTCLWVVALAVRNTIVSYPDTGAFPEAQEVARFLSREMNPGDKVAGRPPVDQPLHFYLRREGVAAGPSRRRADLQRKLFLVVKPSVYSPDDLVSGAAARVFAGGDAAVYVCPLPGR